jgi:hypothetical protein
MTYFILSLTVEVAVPATAADASAVAAGRVGATDIDI